MLERSVGAANQVFMVKSSLIPDLFVSEVTIIELTV